MKSIPILEPIPESINFTKEEEKVLEFWKLVDAFGKCVDESAIGEDGKAKPRFSFYDGPPFATGLPHYGHILAGTIKDIVPRFAHQSGYHVERRFGWDCHGLPVEYEVDKALGINGPQDVMKMGIKAYNDECRKIVMRYSNEWETVIGRLGRWIDFKNDYKTLYPWFMESVWWIFKQLYDKGLVYRGFKVMPFSTACNTPLSNFETAQNYKEVVDPSVIVSFPMLSKPDVSLLAWTTTPWTLPSNLALCVHPEHTYLLVMEKKTSKKFILMEARISSLYRTEQEYEILDKFPGLKLKGEKYEPLFKYFIGEKDKAFKVLADGYVSQDSGTGIVQMAPYFGAEDYRICLDAGVIFKDQDMICPVDSSGRFTEPVNDFLGMYVKDADKAILARLKENGRLINSSTIKHSYPFCWRSDTPLIYRAVPSWFIKVESLVEKLLANNQKTYWVPEFVKEKRFANWLRDAHDWAVSRNRYWGTPIPIWASDDFKEVVCIGSMDDLAKHTGKPSPTDLHREFVDDIVIPSKRPNQPPLKRVPEVFDCWFESGSMPYAQKHYPFENKEKFESGFPADFIAEGVDQTRGWFYTLLVISTALFDKPPFKNLVVNGLVLASDGQKMSKRKKNYPDPMEVVNKYGADALRLYLINSPVVRAENLRFKEDGVRDLLKDVFIPWFNAYRFLIQNVLRVHTEDKYILMFDDKLNEAHSADISKWNIMDRWVLSSVQSLILWFQQEMAAYRLYTVVPRLVKFVESLTNWYVRLNRKRLRGEDSNEDCYRSLEVLYLVMYSLTILMAPFTPFITEMMYQKLKGLIKSEEAKRDSVHHVMIPKPQNWVINKEIETSVGGMQSVIELGRLARDRRAIPTKFPLPEIIVIHSSQDFLNEIKVLENYILQELNIRKMTLSTNKSKYNIKISGEPDHKILGAKYKSDFKAISTEIKGLTGEKLEKCVEKGSIDILGHEILSTEMFIKYSFGEGQATEFEAASSGSVLVILNTLSDSTLKDEFVAREIINRIQKLRKKASLIPTDKMNVFYQTEDKYIASVFENCKDFIKTTVKSDVEPFKKDMKNYMVLMTEDYQFQGTDMTLALAIAKNDNKNGGTACRYVNMIHKREDGVEKNGTILLENPIGCEITKFEQILAEARLVFGLKGKKPVFISENAGHNDVININDKLVEKLHGQTVYLFSSETSSMPIKTTSSLSKKSSKPFVQFLNFDISRAGIRKEGTILLENPVGNQLFESEEEATQFGWRTLYPES